MIPIAKPYLTKEDAQAAYDTILSGWITQGPRVQEFEQKFAAYVGTKYAVAVSNCTTALHLSMLIYGIGPGDEVICPSFSYIATANAIVHSGATPVFADIEPESMNLDPISVEKSITPKTKAILLVHQLGMPADIDAFNAICKKHNLVLIEDAACAVGSKYKGNHIGSHSEIVCFSFHPRKVISTGDGGMLTTNNEKIYNQLRLLRQHGMSVSDTARHSSDKLLFEDHIIVGYNYRMTDIQASVGIKQLEKLDWIIEQRRAIALKYIQELSDIKSIILPIEKEGYFTNYQTFSIYMKPDTNISRNELMQKLLENGISSRRGVMTAHRETAYKEKYKGLKLPVSEDYCDNSIIIPLFVGMTDTEINYIIQQLRKYLI